MRVFTKNTEYAIHALAHIAGRGGIIPARDLSRELAIPQPFLRRILRDLCQAGIVDSVRGQKGGFRLSTGPEKIRILDVMNLFQGPVQVTGCTGTSGCSQENDCTIRENIIGIQQDLVLSLKTKTIASLIRKKGNGLIERSTV